MNRNHSRIAHSLHPQLVSILTARRDCIGAHDNFEAASQEIKAGLRNANVRLYANNDDLISAGHLDHLNKCFVLKRRKFHFSTRVSDVWKKALDGSSHSLGVLLGRQDGNSK